MQGVLAELDSKLGELNSAEAQLREHDPLETVKRNFAEFKDVFDQELAPAFKALREEADWFDERRRELEARQLDIAAKKEDTTEPDREVLMAFVAMAAAMPDKVNMLAPLLPLAVQQARRAYREELTREEESIRQTLYQLGRTKASIDESVANIERQLASTAATTGRMVSRQTLDKLRMIGQLFRSHADTLISYYRALDRSLARSTDRDRQFLRAFYDFYWRTIDHINMLPPDARGFAIREALVNNLIDVTNRLRSSGMQDIIPDLNPYRTALLAYRDTQAALIEATLGHRNAQTAYVMARTLTERERPYQVVANSLATDLRVVADVIDNAQRTVVRRLGNNEIEAAFSAAIPLAATLRGVKEQLIERARQATTQAQRQAIQNAIQQFDEYRNNLIAAMLGAVAKYETPTQGGATLRGATTPEALSEAIQSIPFDTHRKAIMELLNQAGIPYDPAKPPSEEFKRFFQNYWQQR